MLEINNVEYEIKYPVNTLCLMAQDGINVLDMSGMEIDLFTIRELFYYGLKHDNKKITKNQAGELMDAYFEEGGTFIDLIGMIMDALSKSMGRKVDSEPTDEEEVNGEEGK